MKHILIIANGLTDHPVAERDNKTPLQLAETPNLDRLSQNGYCGTVRTIPHESSPENLVSYLSLMGYVGETGGAGHFSAQALGLTLKDNQVPLCCNFVILQSSHNDMVMKDFSAGNLDSGDSKSLLDSLQKNVYDVSVEFHHGRGPHNLVLLDAESVPEKLISPFEMIGEGIRKFLPSDGKSKDLPFLMNQAQIILHNHPMNRQRQKEKKDLINSIWFWGAGPAPKLSQFADMHGRKAVAVSYDLLFQGVAKTAGMEIAPLQEFQDDASANKNLADAALKALADADVVFVHTHFAEAPSLKGMIDDKIFAIEDMDRDLIGPLAQAVELSGEVRLGIIVNQCASVVQMKYDKEPVPFVIYPPVKEKHSAQAFDENLKSLKSEYYESAENWIKTFLN